MNRRLPPRALLIAITALTRFLFKALIFTTSTR
jgi:hypothetical protein